MAERQGAAAGAVAGGQEQGEGTSLACSLRPWLALRCTPACLRLWSSESYFQRLMAETLGKCMQASQAGAVLHKRLRSPADRKTTRYKAVEA
eukprot:51584-Eustigmatos_ZCMA.PRE.1